MRYPFSFKTRCYGKKPHEFQTANFAVNSQIRVFVVPGGYGNMIFKSALPNPTSAHPVVPGLYVGRHLHSDLLV